MSIIVKVIVTVEIYNDFKSLTFEGRAVWKVSVIGRVTGLNVSTPLALPFFLCHQPLYSEYSFIAMLSA